MRGPPGSCGSWGRCRSCSCPWRTSSAWTPQDALRTSATQVRYLVAGIAPALFALLPGILRSGLVLKRFLPESRAPGQITLLAAPVCTVAYLLPLAALAQLAFQSGALPGACCSSPSRPSCRCLAVRRLLRRDPPGRAARLVRTIATIQGMLVVVGALLIVRWLGEHAQLRELARASRTPVWMAGFAAKMLASKWLTTVVVTDVLLAMMDQGRESARSLADTAEGESLARKLDALGHALRPDGTREGLVSSRTPGRRRQAGTKRPDRMETSFTTTG